MGGRVPCPTHPASSATRRCIRCGGRICPACTIRVGLRPFCDKGCSVIYLMQRTAEVEWRIHRRIARGEEISPRLRWTHRRWQRALDTHRALLRDRAVAPPPFRSRLLRWAPLMLVPVAVLLLYWQGVVPPLPSTPPPLVSSPPPPAPGPPPALPSRLVPETPMPEVVPPRVPEGRAFPLGLDISRGPTSERRVVLTFDGGSEANATQEILDVLKARGIRTTIFLTGGYIRRYPDLVRRMVEEGHEVGNHTMHHPHLTTYAENRRHETRKGVDRQLVQRELQQAAALFEEVTGRRMAPYWRAPYGEHNLEIRRWAAELGYLHVSWTRDAAAGEDLDSRDWVADPESQIYASAREIRERILTFGRGRGSGASGGIILLHLGTQRRQDQVHRELPEIIDRFQVQGYRLVTISELLEPVKGVRQEGSAVAAER